MDEGRMSSIPGRRKRWDFRACGMSRRTLLFSCRRFGTPCRSHLQGSCSTKKFFFLGCLRLNP